MSTPNWEPAEQHIPHLLGDVMWMGTEQVHDVHIEQYKHIDSRNYLNLDLDGNAWDIAVHPDTGELSARRIPLATALEQLGGEPR